MGSDPYYKTCARHGHGGCSGRITWEHAFIYAGRQIQEVWAIIPLCWRHHLGDLFNKEINQLIALRRATGLNLYEKYPRENWIQKLKYLESKYEDTGI